MMKYICCFFLLLFSSCGHSPFRGNEVVGADEFVMDSYKIREGKFAILELEGKEFNSLPTDALQEYELKAPGKVEFAGLTKISSLPVDGKLRLFEALSAAQTSPQANFFKSYIIRDNQILAVDLSKLVHEGDMSQNIVLKDGDKIYIAEPAASAIMLFGEVGNQGVIDLPTGSLSLKMALAQAGGISYFGDKSFIQVIRGNLTKPKIYTLHWNHVMRLPNDSLLLIPGDIVYVASTPITQWNRFVSQILPTLVTINLVSKGEKNVGIIVP